jgi:hypothetical protein
MLTPSMNPKSPKLRCCLPVDAQFRGEQHLNGQRRRRSVSTYAWIVRSNASYLPFETSRSATDCE